MTKVAMIGFGGIAQSVHLPAHLKLEQEGRSKLVAVCDVDHNRFEKAMEINIGGSELKLGDDVKRYTDWQEMLDNEEVDMVDICVPTYLHAPIAKAVLARGIHVLSEKPMSISYEESLSMCEAAKAADRKLMIGQCVRFAAPYNFVRDAVQNNTFGKIVTGVFRRMSGPPIWGWDNWFMDYERSRGCILDMHIHDIDFIRYMMGEPDAVSCETKDFYSGRDVAHSRLYYGDASFLVIGDWSLEGVEFCADFRISFEKATVVFAGGKLTVYPRGGEAYEPEVSDKDWYFAEIEFFLDMLQKGVENTVNKPESAALSVRLIDALCESADKGGEKIAYSL